MVTDIRLMKQLNFNAVRASHYPNHTRWCASCPLWELTIADSSDHAMYIQQEHLLLSCDAASVRPRVTMPGRSCTESRCRGYATRFLRTRLVS